jgi:hypothetical protein
VVFRSFKAGYLKRIDLDVYRRLQSAIAKRLYRLLDKRFYHKGRWEFDLRELACEHVGLSRKYDASQIKRKLRPAIAELEDLRFLQPLSSEQQFRQVCPGKWTVQFITQRKKTAAPLPADNKRTKSCNRKDRMSTILGRGTTKASGSQAKRRREERAKEYLESLDPDVRDRLHREAFDSAKPFLLSCYKRSAEDGNAAFTEAYREAILYGHVWKLLVTRESKKK